MEGLSGEGTRRRREYTEDTEVREPTIEDIERAKEQALERIDTSREPEVSAKEYVHRLVREALEEDGNDEKISRKMGEALQDLKKMEEFRESIERRKEEALERIDLSRREVMEDSSEEQGETGESRFEDIRSQEEREAEMARRKEAILEKLEMREVIDDSLEEIDKTDESHSAEIRTQEEYDGVINNQPELKSREDFEKNEAEAAAYTESLEQYLETEEVDHVEAVEKFERSERQDLVQETPSRLQELDEAWIRNATTELNSKELTGKSLAKQLSEISRSLPDSSRTFYIDIERSLGLSRKELDSFEKAFHQAKEGLDEVDGARLGLVGERLYVWKPDLESTGLENVYDGLYYYFRDKPTFERYINDVGDSLGLQDMSLKETLKYLQELAPQVVAEESKDYCLNSRRQRIRGDYVNLMNDMSGKTLSDLEGDISKLTKPSGKGGITNPRFPEGEIYEVALSRLTAVAISDCHLQPNGTLHYSESEMSRIKIVETELQAFGDIRLSPKFRQGDNVYLSYFPTPLGVMLERLGIPSGDRSVQNPGLFSVIKEFSPRARCALIEDLVPQDGTISGQWIQWTHTNVLDAASKSEVYGIEPKVGDSEIGLIKKYGKKERYSWVLNYGKLKELRDSDSENEQQIAQDLWNCVYDNRNRLIRDEIEVVRSLGVEYQAKPYAIRYHIRTGRVSVAWTAVPKGLRESIKLGMIAPPNDEIKRGIVKEIIRNHQQHVEDELRRFKDHGVEIDKWWGVEE